MALFLILPHLILGDVISIKIGNKGPYGMSLGPDNAGNGLIILSWERLPDGKFGQIQKHGGVHIGDALAYVNDINMGGVSHKDASGVLNDPNLLKKEIKFMSAREYYRKK